MFNTIIKNDNFIDQPFFPKCPHPWCPQPWLLFPLVFPHPWLVPCPNPGCWLPWPQPELLLLNWPHPWADVLAVGWPQPGCPHPFGSFTVGWTDWPHWFITPVNWGALKPGKNPCCCWGFVVPGTIGTTGSMVNFGSPGTIGCTGWTGCTGCCCWGRGWDAGTIIQVWLGP